MMKMKRIDWAQLGMMLAICFGLVWLIGCAAKPKPVPAERVIPPVGQTPPLCNYIEVRP